MPDIFRHTQQLQENISNGFKPDYLFFWNHRPDKSGTTSKSCLSQWHDGSPFTVDNVLYASAEQFMMAYKARVFNDPVTEEEIMQTTSPADMKTLGRKIKGFAGVVKGNIAKFSQHQELCSFLLSTEQRVLVEASPYDCVWGIGLAAHDPRAMDIAKWRGPNQLGVALMEVREHIALQLQAKQDTFYDNFSP